MRTLLIVFLLASLSGCATAPSADVMAAADYGEYPQNYQAIVKAYVSDSLKDPDSAQYTFLNFPMRGYWGFGGAKFGYVTCVKINAKNSFGGYTGYRINYFMIKNGAIIDATISQAGEYGEMVAAAKCKQYPVERVI
jgi:hypothetical protein